MLKPVVKLGLLLVKLITRIVALIGVIHYTF